MTHRRVMAAGAAVVAALAVGCGDDDDGPTTTITEADPDPTPGAATDRGDDAEDGDGVEDRETDEGT